MNFIDEAKKFIQRAANADNADVVKENLKMAEWCLSQEIKDRDARALPGENASPPDRSGIRLGSQGGDGTVRARP